MNTKQEIQQLNRDTQYIRGEREELVNELEGKNMYHNQAQEVSTVEPQSVMEAVLKRLNVKRKCMARKFVMYHLQWSENCDWAHENNVGFIDWLHHFDLIGDGERRVLFLNFSDCRPTTDGEFDEVICRYQVMDFEDGSIAIRRSHEYERGDRGHWQVADVGHERGYA